MNSASSLAKAKRSISPPIGREQVVEAVLNAATDLFATTPFDQVTTRMIAARAGVNLGLIHRHLGSKKDLLHAVLQRYAARFRGEVLVAKDPGAAFRLLLEDPGQASFARTLAFMILSGFELDEVMSRTGAIREMVRSAKSGKQALDPSNHETEAKVVAGWSMIMGWLLFEPFLLRAAGIPNGADDVQRVLTKKLAHLFDGSTSARRKP